MAGNGLSEHLQRCSVRDPILHKYFSHPSFSYLLFGKPTPKTETVRAKINTEPQSGPIYYTLLYAGATALLSLLPPVTGQRLHPILLCRITYGAHSWRCSRARWRRLERSFWWTCFWTTMLQNRCYIGFQSSSSRCDKIARLLHRGCVNSCSSVGWGESQGLSEALERIRVSVLGLGLKPWLLPFLEWKVYKKLRNVCKYISSLTELESKLHSHQLRIRTLSASCMTVVQTSGVNGLLFCWYVS